MLLAQGDIKSINNNFKLKFHTIGRLLGHKSKLFFTQQSLPGLITSLSLPDLTSLCGVGAPLLPWSFKLPCDKVVLKVGLRDMRGFITPVEEERGAAPGSDFTVESR